MYKIIGANQAVYGPVTDAQLRQWIAEGRADANTMTQLAGTSDWKPLREFSEFTAALAGQSGSSPLETTSITVPSYLLPATVCTLLACPPFGILAVVFALQVSGKLEAGDYAGAKAASRKAKIWCWVSFGLGLFVYAFVGLFLWLIGM